VPESARTRLFRVFFNLFPAYRRTGGRVTHIAADWSEVRVRLPLNWTTRNYVGTIFGGSLYGAVDPVYMIMLLKRLGDDFIVWDKAATIHFRRPGRSTLRAAFHVPDEEIAAIRKALDAERSIDRVYSVDLTAEDGTVCATVEKTLYVRRKDGR
jgi:acyl-coenzyme A thioesterase PaaI-like protein